MVGGREGDDRNGKEHGEDRDLGKQREDKDGFQMGVLRREDGSVASRTGGIAWITEAAGTTAAAH
jgi:hypothetical protein